MYLDQQSGLRTEWNYTYKCSELLPYVEKKLIYYYDKSNIAKDNLNRLLNKKGMLDEQVLKAHYKEVETYGKIYEQYYVWDKEFARTPDREIQLGMSDIIFFFTGEGL